MEPDSLEALFVQFRERGDARALAEIFDRTAPELLVLARRLVLDVASAEDVVQETFVVAIEQRARFDANRSLLPWLVGVLANEARKSRRRAARSPQTTGAEPTSDPRDAVFENELDQALRGAVAELPEHYARVLALHLVQGLEPREVAARLELEPGTVRVQLHRGLAQLRKALPPGFALGAAATVIESRGLASVREAVLAKAAGVKTAATIPLALVALIALVVCTLAGAGAWAWRTSASAHSRELALAADANASAPEPARAAAEPSALERLAPANVAREHAADPALASAQASARYTGRLVFEGGAPARGATVRVRFARRWFVNPGDDRELPKDWKEPAPVSVDDAGRFALLVPAVERLSLDLEASAPGRARVAWSWPPEDGSSPKAGDVIDLGDAELVQGGALELRVVDAKGNELDDARWRLSASPLAPPNGRARVPSSAGAALDPKTKRARIEDLAPGTWRVSAEHPVTGRVRGANVEVRANELAEAAITSTIETRGRLVLATFVETFRGYVPELERIHLARPGMEPRSPVVAEGTGSEFAWEGLADGEYTLEIDDPRFERFVRPGVKPGERVNATLRGSAALELALTANGKRVERCKASVEIDGRTIAYGKDFAKKAWVKREVQLQRGPYPLVDGTAPFPADGIVRGLVPGTCVLHLEAPGFPAKRVEVAELRAGETRKLALELASDAASKESGLATGGASKERGLAGVVRGADGKTPLANVVVTATRGNVAGRKGAERGLRTAIVPGRGKVRVPGIDFETRTDAAGRFRFDEAVAGEWTVDVAWSPWLESEQTVTLGASASVPLELTEPPSGFLVGALKTPKGVDPRTVEVQLEPRVATQRSDVGGLFQGATTEFVKADGAFRFGPLPAGDVEVSVLDVHAVADASSTTTFRSMRRIARASIAKGAETRLDLDLTGAIGGKVALDVRVAGTRVAGLAATLVAPTPDVARFPTTLALSDAGTATMTAPGGSVSLALVIEGPGRSWLWSAPRIEGLAPDETRALALDVPMHAASVRVVDADTGAPLAAAKVTATMRAEGLRSASTAGTDANGVLELRLPPGMVELARFGGNAEDGVALAWPPAAGSTPEIRLAPKR